MSKITMEQLSSRLQAMGTGGVRKAIFPVLITACQKVVEEVKLNRLSGQTLRSRSGHLRSSVAASVENVSGVAAIVARAGGSGGRGPVAYASIHEHGGTVVPRRAKMLRIPIPGSPAMTGAGVGTRGGPLRLSAPGEFFVSRSRAGNLLLRHRVTGVPWYVLKYSVFIPARPYLLPGVQKVQREYLDQALGRAIATSIMYGPGASSGGGL